MPPPDFNTHDTAQESTTLRDADLRLQDIMFPVERVNVFAAVGPSSFRQFHGRKALINAVTGDVLSVVSDRYQVLTNQDALNLAIKACCRVIPSRRPHAWSVSAVGAPSTRARCWFDLQHPDFPSVQVRPDDIWESIVRVTNSYNRTRAFCLQIGFMRYACENRVLVRAGALLKVSVHHNVPGIAEAIEREIEDLDPVEVERAAVEFRRLLERLLRVAIPRHRFRALVQSVLKIQKPKAMSANRDSAWKALEQAIDRIRDEYVNDLGETAYALFNTITDLATDPRNYDRGRFIRRERHTLHQLAGTWLHAFHELSRSKASLARYIESPSWSILLPGAGNGDQVLGAHRRMPSA